MSSLPGESVNWQLRCQELEQIIKTLSSHCLNVVAKYEDLLTNYKNNQEQYNNLVQKLKDKGEQIKKARDVLQPIIVEYQTLRQKYDLAVACQYEAESFASKMNHKNKVLKRQSQMILEKVGGLNVVEIKFEDDVADADTDETEYCRKLDIKIQELSEENSALSAQLKAIQEDNELEKERNKQLKEKLDMCKVELKQAKNTIASQEKMLLELEKTSEAAYREYEELKKQCKLEYENRTHVEKIAHNFHVERDAAVRQSAFLMKDVGNDKKLMTALIEVENINTEMAKMKTELEQKIRVLEDELKAEKEKCNAKVLESENDSLVQERDKLLQKVADAENTTAELRSQYSLLTLQYADLEKKYDNLTHAPPPPPPPPPPPLPPITRTEGFLSKITGGKKKRVQQRLADGGADVSKDYSKAIEEMMKRIKQGKFGLKAVQINNMADDSVDSAEGNSSRKISLKSNEEDGKAIKELQNILSKMKKVRSEDDMVSVSESPPDNESEFAQAFKKIQQAKQEKSNEIMKPTPKRRQAVNKDEQQ